MELNGKKQNLSFFKLNQISQRYCKILFESNNICADFKLSLSAKLSDHMRLLASRGKYSSIAK